MPGLRRRPQRQLGHHGAVATDPLLQCGIFRRVDGVDPAGDASDRRPGFERAPVGRRVNAAREAGDHQQPGSGQVLRHPLGNPPAVRRGVAAADDGDGPAREQVRIALHRDHWRRIIEARKQSGVGGVAEKQQRRALPGDLLQLPLGIARAGNPQRGHPPAGPCQLWKCGERRRRGAETRQQFSERNRPDALGASEAQEVYIGHFPAPMRGSVPRTRRSILPRWRR